MASPKWDAQRLETPIVIVGGILCVIGACFSLIGVAGLGKNLSPYPKPKEESELIERGVYSIVRHPIYCGLILFAFGWSFAWGSWSAFFFAVALFIFFDLKSRKEEVWLDKKFSTYQDYRHRVRKLIPFIY